MLQAGVQAQALLSDNIILDFSGLFSGEPIEKAPSKSPVEPTKSPVEPLLDSGLYKTLTERKKPVEGLKTGLQGIPQKEPPERAKNEIKRIFRNAYDFYETAKPPAYFDIAMWSELGEKLIKIADSFENSEHADLARALLLAVFEEVERQSKKAYDMQKNL